MSARALALPSMSRPGAPSGGSVASVASRRPSRSCTNTRWSSPPVANRPSSSSTAAHRHGLSCRPGAPIWAPVDASTCCAAIAADREQPVAVRAMLHVEALPRRARAAPVPVRHRSRRTCARHRLRRPSRCVAGQATTARAAAGPDARAAPPPSRCRGRRPPRCRRATPSAPLRRSALNSIDTIAARCSRHSGAGACSAATCRPGHPWNTTRSPAWFHSTASG